MVAFFTFTIAVYLYLVGATVYIVRRRFRAGEVD
jgi:hypothetical protein